MYSLTVTILQVLTKKPKKTFFSYAFIASNVTHDYFKQVIHFLSSELVFNIAYDVNEGIWMEFDLFIQVKNSQASHKLLKCWSCAMNNIKPCSIYYDWINGKIIYPDVIHLIILIYQYLSFMVSYLLFAISLFLSTLVMCGKIPHRLKNEFPSTILCNSSKDSVAIIFCIWALMSPSVIFFNLMINFLIN